MMNINSRCLIYTVRNLIILVLIVLTPALLRAASASGQRTFEKPEDAINALIQAADHDDTAALLQILGPDGKEIVQSGDRARDKADRQEFVRLARQRLEVNRDPSNPDQVTFSIGDEDWPVPVPLARQNAKWEFDSLKGKVEILAHRIGENESNTIDTCRAFVEAEFEYAASPHDGSRILQYAQRIVSSKGRQDGLYSEDPGKALVPLSFAKAVASEGNANPEPYHGYYFRLLREQGTDSPGGAIHYIVDDKMIGGFALIAWPADYGSTGIQTFMVNHQGIVYAKDLGPDTAKVVDQMSAFNPDKSWHPAQIE